VETFSIPIEVGTITNGQHVGVEALVDTGATHSVFPASLLRKVGIQPVATMRFMLADERKVEYPVGQAAVRIADRSWIVSVVFGPDDATPILGATTLETFGLAVDPVGKQLVPVDGLLK
jgi:clan AA aspartic protease